MKRIRGAKIIQDLQALVGIVESEEQAEKGWNALSESAKENTISAHKCLIGGET